MGNSTNKDLAEPASGTTNWDVILNDNFSIIDSALAGLGTIALGSATTYTPTTDELQPLQLAFTGTASCVVTIPNNGAGDPISGQWLVYNNTSGTLSIENIETPGTYAVIPTLCSAWVLSDGVTAYIIQTPVLPAKDDGTKSSGSFKPKFSEGVFHYLTNDGAFTLQAPTVSGSYEMFILVTNGASAGTITMTGFTGISGVDMSTTNADKYLIRITRVNTTVTAEVLSLQQSKSSFVSAEQTITNGAVLTISHDLGVAPSILQWRIICKVAEAGYAIGDVIYLTDFGTSSNANDNKTNSALVTDTNIKIMFCDNASGKSFSVPHKTTCVITALTNASWRLIIAAYVL